MIILEYSPEITLRIIRLIHKLLHTYTAFCTGNSVYQIFIDFFSIRKIRSAIDHFFIGVYKNFASVNNVVGKCDLFRKVFPKDITINFHIVIYKHVHRQILRKNSLPRLKSDAETQICISEIPCFYSKYRSTYIGRNLVTSYIKKQINTSIRDGFQLMCFSLSKRKFIKMRNSKLWTVQLPEFINS